MVAKKKFINDDIVISGMSGRFPKCDTVEEFQEKLLSGVDLVEEDDSRWPSGYLNTYSRMGFLKDLRNFDAPYFGAHPKLAERTDPIVRVLLEISVEAVMDAGICPTALRGSETGVVVVVSSNEAADWWSADPDRVNGYEFLGCTRTMYSNRISFVMDLKGPSYTMDSQSSSGLLGIQQAYYMLKSGMVDAVIVAGVNLVLNPHFNIMFKKLNMLSPEGKCKVFDADADGYARSEGGVALLLQRASDAKRIYATIAAADSNCDGFKEYGCNTESLSSQISLYEDTISKFQVNPLDISFVEVHGYSTLDGDAVELNGITEVFCKGRKSPLMVGSVKTNMGHGEPVGGLVSVVKVLLAMESGILPPNLHFKSPNPNVPALIDGRLQVVDRLTIWDGKYAAINSFGIGGTNSHLVLKRNEKDKKSCDRTTSLRLMAVSGRTEAAVQSLLNKLKYLQGDNELCALLYDVFSRHIPHFNYRGFALFDAETVIETATYTPQDTARPICFVFSGMGSQWPGMCKDLLSLEIFKRTIDACAATLQLVNFDLYALLNSKDHEIFDNVLNSFVGITCIQIAFVNILYELGIKPNFIVGHSVGELACAYADETLTLEQTVLTTYWRGKCLLMTNLPAGSMAAVGLPSSQVEKLLSGDITIACHNSSDSVTISGPPKSIQDFTKKLTSEGIFAREVNSSGYAFHSQYIAKAGPAFKSTLEKIIPQPKLRTKRWISTSVRESMWNTPSAQYSSVAYHLNNLLSPVYFDKALAYIPENSIVIEIAPHALLQSILKGSVSANCTHIGLVRRNQASVSHLLTNIGRLYNAGLHPNLSRLYPPVSFPVSRKTPMIQSIIEWDHSVKWFLISFMTKPSCVRGEIEAVVDITDKRYKFLVNCVIDNLPTFPVSGYLCLIWETVAKFQIKYIPEVPVVIENFQVLRKCTLNRENPLKFTINILEETGDCEIKENGILVARANVRILKGTESEFSNLHRVGADHDNCSLPLKSTDFYLDLHKKGYLYMKEFQVVKHTDNKGESGLIKWTNNWITYLEGLLQMHLLQMTRQSHYAINHIQKIIIDPQKHISSINSDTGSVNVFPETGVIKSGGIELRGIRSTLVSVENNQQESIVEQYCFVPHVSDKIKSVDEALNICVQLVCENSDTNSVLKVAEVFMGTSSHECLSTRIAKIIDREPYITSEMTLFSQSFPEFLASNIGIKNEDLTASPTSEKYNFLATSNILAQPKVLKNTLNSLIDNGFLFTIEELKNDYNDDDLDAINCKLIAKFNTNEGVSMLIRRTPVWKTPMVVIVKNDNLNWIDGVKMALRKHKIDKRNTMLIFHGNEATGVIGFMKCIRREPYGTGLRCLITDNSIQPYKIVDLTHINYLRKGLAFNVHKNGEWGSYRHSTVEASTIDCEHAFVGLKEVGNFSSLTYFEGRMPYINIAESDRELCHVYYAAVYPHRDVFHAIGLLPYNDDQVVKFKQELLFYNSLQDYPNHELCYAYYTCIYAHDIRSALGHLPYDDTYNVTKQGSVLGHEYSGRDSKGKRVCGMVGGGALATTVLADRRIMWDVPDEWTLEQASTVPRVYSAAFYTLIMRGQLQEKETVYIHAGIMGLCVACLNVALGAKAVPYIGFNNQAEKGYLKKTFPQLPETSFINLEDSSFEYRLLELTSGKGVNLIFDTLNSHKRNLFTDALAYNGRLIEFEKSSAFNESLGYAAIEKNITFHKVSHYTLWVSESGEEDRIKIQKLVAEGVRNGVVKPIVTNIFTDQQLEEAFRVAQSGKFVGKVVIKIRDEETTKNMIPKPRAVRACPSLFLNAEHSYIITTGLSEYGIELANWLVSRGAKQIVLQSPYKPVTGYQHLALRRWRNLNVNIAISNADIHTASGAENLIRTATQLGSVGGIFHVAYVACDFLFEECTKNHFDFLWKSKVETTKNLDVVSRTLCPTLKYFVGFSDLSSSFGCMKKSMLGYSCAAMEMIFEERKYSGYAATIIQTGILDKCDVGIANVYDQRFIPIKFSSILKTLPDLLNQTTTIHSLYVKDKTLQDELKFTKLESVTTVADILGIKCVEKLYYTTLERIGIEPLVLAEIEEYLKSRGINIAKNTIKKLSLHKIAKLL